MKTVTWVAVAMGTLFVSTGATQPERFVLAIARMDGRLVPFASYDTGAWEQAWPEAASTGWSLRKRLPAADRVFWVLLQRGHEGEAYAVVDIGPDQIRYPITVHGGGC